MILAFLFSLISDLYASCHTELPSDHSCLPALPPRLLAFLVPPSLSLCLALCSSQYLWYYSSLTPSYTSLLIDTCFIWLISFVFFFSIYLFLTALGPCCCKRDFLCLWQVGATIGCGVQASHCSGFFVATHGHLELVGSAAVAHRLSCSLACGNLPKPGIEPLSPALASGFSATGPPGASPSGLFLLTPSI